MPLHPGIAAVTGVEIAFYLLGALALASSLLVVANRNPVASLLFLVFSFFCLAGLFVTLEAHFIAAIQILIYAGAILVLFLFVIMLLNLGTPQGLLRVRRPLALGIAVLAGLAFVALLAPAFSRGVPGPRVDPLEAGAEAAAPLVGSTERVGVALFSDFLLPFEVTSLLLLVAMVGAVMIAKRER